jgi:hypothetical protein
MTDYPIHPACALWPRPSDEEVAKIAESIKAEGLLNPIWLYEGAILDGKIRYEACGIAGVEPRFQEYTGDDPVGFTISQNKLRRQMRLEELAFTVAELCKLPHGGNRGNRYTSPSKLQAHGLLESSETVKKLALLAGIGETSVYGAKSLLKKGESNIIEMARTGKVGIASAAVFARQTPRQQQLTATVNDVKGSSGKRPSLKKKLQPMITIPYPDVIDKLRPLIKRVKEQSKRHAATVSFMELSIIAHELEQLVNAWTENGPELGTHSDPVPFNRVCKGG